MNFLAPASFLFALTIPVVVVFYLLKRRRVVKLVSSTLLWQKFLAETQASAPFQKLRRNWLLIIQILLLLLAVLALSRPYFRTKAAASDLRVLILDASASMQSTDESPSRFEQARKQALAWVDSLREGDKMVVLQVAANTEVKQSQTSDKAALRRAILSCNAIDSPTRLVPALKMAESLVRDYGDKNSNPEIHLFSDGAVPDSSVFDNKTLPLIYHKIGRDANNLGITALDVRPNFEDPTQRAVYASIANFSTNTLETELDLTLDGQVAAAPRPVTVKPGEILPEVFFATQTNDGVFTVRSTSKDDLAADNEASIVSLLPHPVKVLLVTHGNQPLEKALRVVPDMDLTVADDLKNDGLAYDFVTLDGVVPTIWPKGNVLAIQVMQTNWFESVSNVDLPVIVDTRHDHPVLFSLNLDALRVFKSLVAKPPSWGVSLVDSQQASLIIGGDLGRQRILWLGFDVLDSNWRRHTSFPEFFQNAVDWLNPATIRNRQLLVHAGDPFRLALTQPVSSAQITLPDGGVRTLQVDTNATEIVFGDTFHQGKYRLKVGPSETVFCVALLDEAESNIKPRDELQFGKYTRVSASTVHRANLELWRTIAAIALCVLLFEWWYYHRRTV